MNLAAPACENSCAFTPGLYLARISWAGRGPSEVSMARRAGTLEASENCPREGLYTPPSGASFIHADPGGRTQAFMWCTTRRFPGRTSAAFTQISCGKLTFTRRLD